MRTIRPRAYLITTAEGHEACLKDQAAAEHYMVRNRGRLDGLFTRGDLTVVALPKETTTMKPILTEQDFVRAANRIRCSVAAIKAVAEIEAPRGGFNPDGSLTTLFEAHHFHRFTHGRYDASHPNLSSPTWNRALYGATWQAERVRYAAAGALDPVAAILSTSFGRFQIMGFNHAVCGFSDGADMVESFSTGEPAQLDGFVTFILTRGLDDELRDCRWIPFALAYNGPRAQEQGYDRRIASAFLRHSAA